MMGEKMIGFKSLTEHIPFTHLTWTLMVRLVGD